MSSLSDSIAQSSNIQAWKEYRKRKQEELDKLWAESTRREKAFARKVLKLAFETI